LKLYQRRSVQLHDQPLSYLGRHQSVQAPQRLAQFVRSALLPELAWVVALAAGASARRRLRLDQRRLCAGTYDSRRRRVRLGCPSQRQH